LLSCDADCDVTPSKDGVVWRVIECDGGSNVACKSLTFWILIIIGQPGSISRATTVNRRVARFESSPRSRPPKLTCLNSFQRPPICTLERRPCLIIGAGRHSQRSQLILRSSFGSPAPEPMDRTGTRPASSRQRSVPMGDLEIPRQGIEQARLPIDDPLRRTWVVAPPPIGLPVRLLCDFPESITCSRARFAQEAWVWKPTPQCAPPSKRIRSA
jgi:hypothetical protein